MTRVDYTYLTKAIASLTEGEDDVIALMATFACELHHSDDRFDWTGFYRVTSPQMLKIGPYQGVSDVESFVGHIACASTTRSELVLPVWGKSGALLAVLDIDSDQPSAFSQTDADALAKVLASVFSY